MSDLTEQSVLRRMTTMAPSAPGTGVGDEESSPAILFPRTADELLGLPVEVRSVSEQTRPLVDALDGLTDNDLIYQLSVGKEASGILVVDAGLLAAVVEVQTTGRVSGAPVGERKPSRIDGVVASELADRWLVDIRQFQPSEYSRVVREDRVLDLRAVELALDPGLYTRMQIKMDVASGAKTGVMNLILPVRRTEGGSRHASNGNCTSSIATLAVDLRVDMGEVRVPLSSLLRLERGQVFSLPSRDHRRGSLRSDDGRLVAEVVLGQTDGYWAFRLLPAEVETNSKDGVPLQIAISQNGDLAAESPSESEIVQGPVEEQMNVPGEPLEPLGTVLDINQIELPELPDLPDLPDLADLPDLPSVPQADEPLT